MPFTLAHPAAALLLRGTPLPLTAVVAGTMAPDVPVFLNAYGDPYDLTHSLLGVVTVDLLVAAVAVALWFGLLRDPVVDLLPAPVRARVDPAAHLTRQQWMLVAPAAVLGSLTHLGWDSFTHRDEGVLEWAQYGSSVLGLTVCAFWAVLALRSREHRPHPRTDPWLDTRALVVLGVVTLGSALAAGLNAPEPGWRMFLSQTAIVGTLTGAAGVALVAVLWQVRRRFLP